MRTLRRGLPAVVVLGLTLAAGLAGGQRAGAAGGAGVISTVAGGVGGPGRATQVDVNTPCGVSSGGGRLYVAAFSVVRQVNPATDWLTTPAGTPNAPFGEGGPAPSAGMGACAAAVDQRGNLVIADYLNQRVRVVAASTGTFYGRAMTKGHIYTVAGTGTSGFSGDRGPATQAELNFPSGVAVDAAGNLLIADSGNYRIRVVAASTGTFYGRAMTGGDIYTVAGNGTLGFAGDGGKATLAELNFPSGVAVDAAGNLVIADTENNRVRVVAEKTGMFYGTAMTKGDIYTVAGGGTSLGDGGPATAAQLNVPNGVAVGAAGNLVIADSANNRIRMVAARSGTFYGQVMTKGDIYTVAGTGTPGYSGDGAPAASAKLNFPQGVAVDAAGNLVIADTENSRVRVVAARSGTFYAEAMTAGHIYTVASNGGPGSQDGEPGYSGDGGPAQRAELANPTAVVVDGAGNLVLADSAAGRIRVVAAGSGTFYGRPMTAGDIYAVAGDGNPAYSGDGAAATRAGLNPAGVALDGAGNLVIADSSNNRIRVVAAKSGTFYGRAMTKGDIYTVAGNGRQGFSGDGGPATRARLHRPAGAGVDAAGNLLIADTGNNRIRVVAEHTGTFYGHAMTTGDIYSVAAPRGPGNVVADHAGNLVVADTGSWVVQVVAGSTGTFYQQQMTAGGTYTVAGNGGCGFFGDGGPATATSLCEPEGVAVDGHGNLLIADTDNDRIRVVAEHTGTFYGQAMTTGDIYTVAGMGAQQYSGDGGPATAAGLDLPGSVTVTSTGTLVIADSNNHRIREVTG